MKLLKGILGFIWSAFMFSLLTVITQIGGIIYVLNQIPAYYLNKHINNKKKRFWRSTASFLILYLSISLLLIPPIAKQYGRVPLPWFASETEPLKPLNWMFCLLNRHYVRPALKVELIHAAQQLAKKYPASQLVYLDADFPFLEHFPLLPHRSHHDGKKVDVAFLYKDESGNMLHGGSPSIIGYGVCESPRKGEYNTTTVCENKGYWQYGALEKIIPQWRKSSYQFDAVRTKFLTTHFATRAKIGKIFIEPHLKTRLGLSSYSKIRFHGCPAVRHDDHLHIQL